MLRLVVCLLVLPVLAGCAEEAPTGLRTASVAVDWSGQREEGLPRNVHATIEYDPASRPSAPMYEERDMDHPVAYTVHDLLVDWDQENGPGFTYAYQDGLGYLVHAIAGVEARQDEDGASWFWRLEVNGAPANQGISSMQVEEGGAYTWRYTRFAA